MFGWLFGSPRLSVKDPGIEVYGALSVLAEAWDCIFPSKPNPLRDTDGVFVGDRVSIHGSRHGGSWNLAWKDVRLSWGRDFNDGLETNRMASSEEATAILQDAMHDFRVANGEDVGDA